MFQSRPWLVAAFMLLAAAPAGAAKLQPDLAAVARMQATELSSAKVAQGLRAASQRKREPLQFAVPVPMELGLSDGQWDDAGTGTARWRLKLYSPDAVSLHVHFSRLHLPQGAELWFYDARGEWVQGPITQTQKTADGRLATPVVMGDTAALELRVPAAVKKDVDLAIGEVFHGFMDIRKAGGGPSAKAGACERDVACPEGQSWSGEVQSVVRLQTGQYLCSGQLLNNTRQDETPFLVTANHCGVDASNASNVVAYFNFQRPQCGSGNGTLEYSISGARFLRNDPDSDFSLMVLNNRPAASFNPYYSGWDASGEDVSSGVGIHHPQGDEKSISLFDTPARRIENGCSAQDGNGNCIMVIDSWEVGWRSGVTEQGSSGSGLWNQKQRLVGVLSGGSSNCNGNSGNGGTDFYGRFDVAWKTGGFKADLDPDNTGAVVLDGKCGTGAPVCGATAPTARASSGRFGSGALGWPLSLAGLLLVCLRMLRRAPRR